MNNNSTKNIALNILEIIKSKVFLTVGIILILLVTVGYTVSYFSAKNISKVDNKIIQTDLAEVTEEIPEKTELNITDLESTETTADSIESSEPVNSPNPKTTQKPVQKPASNNVSSSPITNSDPDVPESIQDDKPEPEPENMPESPSAIVAFYADTQTDTETEQQNHQKVVDFLSKTNASTIFHAGDLMEDGTQASLNYFNQATNNLRSQKNFYSALGNNDRKVDNSSLPSPLYLANFSLPNNEKWYSVNIGNLHMVVLDSAFSAASQDQLNWLTEDLQSSASQDRITGVMFHHPTFVPSIQQHLNNYGVDFVVSGHIHSYTHVVDNNVHYFTTTGQPTIGYFLAEIYSNKTIFKIYNSNNNLVETISFNER